MKESFLLPGGATLMLISQHVKFACSFVFVNSFITPLNTLFHKRLAGSAVGKHPKSELATWLREDINADSATVKHKKLKV
ncbi:hypothetical protein JTE90_000936 [Oedothorax gibbosus]|uniref:Uncharacterized protein n=1 Tax=Oedothorax gibbosus TaxID=931172 RepID=A0AAV6U370_9ARAC|nr:hypothetical protein JTE90_000936 [Oedothorax gibbosus]